MTLHIDCLNVAHMILTALRSLIMNNNLNNCGLFHYSLALLESTSADNANGDGATPDVTPNRWWWNMRRCHYATAGIPVIIGNLILVIA